MNLTVALKKVANYPFSAIQKKVRRKKEDKIVKARQRLHNLISTGWPLKQEFHAEVLKILKRKPFLASESFHESISGHSTSPLSYLIGGGASLDVIKQVYQLCPEVIFIPWPEDTYPPLMGACHSGVADEVIDFLVKEFPGALYKQDFEGSLPIHIYMRRAPYGPSLEVIKTMVDAYPESIIIDDKVGWGLSPIDYALRLDFDARILEYFIQQWPKGENDYGLFWDSNSDNFPETIGFEKVQVLVKLMPKLDFFHSFLDEWTCEGLIHVIDHLRTNRTVVDVCLRLPCQLMVNDRRVLDALTRCIKENKSITKLTLLGTRKAIRGPDVVDDAYLGELLDAIASNQRIQDLNLSDFTLQNGHKLNTYFCSGVAPRTVTFTDVAVHDPWCRKSAPREHHCGVQRLTFNYCNLYTPWYQGFLAQLQYIPAIQELNVLQSHTEHNVTNLLVGCLETGSLTSVRVAGYNVTPHRLADALKNNNTLIRLDADFAANMEWKRQTLAETLEAHNTTVQHIELKDRVAKYGPQGQKIIYFSMLNKYGRGRIRSVSSCGEDFVGILDAVNSDACLGAIEACNVLYGLLSEHPSLWSAPNFSEEKTKVVGGAVTTVEKGRVLIDT